MSRRNSSRSLTALVVGLYVLIVQSLAMLFQSRGGLVFSLVATGIVAVLFQPLRERIQRNVNRLMYGERDEPYAVVSRLGQQLEATLSPDAVLPTIVETVARALKLPYAAIALRQGKEMFIAAEFGDRPTRRGGDKETRVDSDASQASLSPYLLVTDLSG